MNASNTIFWVFKLVAATIMLQTLFFKFTAAPESVYIFSTLGAEPYGRMGTGIIELIASILLLIPRTSFIGAMLGLGTMIGAILSHIFILGIVVHNDGGKLFVLGVITALCCALVAIKNKNQFTSLMRIFNGRKN